MKYRNEREMIAALLESGSTKIDAHEKAVALYHEIRPEDTFDDAAQALFGILCYAQASFPDQPRCLFLDIYGHRNPVGGFDDDMVELQNYFIIGMLSDWLTEVRMPLASFLTAEQHNDVPPDLTIE